MPAGTLDVTVLRATGLRDSQTFGRQDPYFIIQVGTKHFTSRTATDGGKNPEWNQKFTFDITDERKIYFTIKNKNVMTTDDILGNAEVILETAFASGKHDFRGQVITKDGRVKGELAAIILFNAHQKKEKAGKNKNGGATPAGYPQGYPNQSPMQTGGGFPGYPGQAPGPAYNAYRPPQTGMPAPFGQQPGAPPMAQGGYPGSTPPPGNLYGSTPNAPPPAYSGAPGGYPSSGGGYPSPGGGAPGGYPAPGGAPGGYPAPGGAPGRYTTPGSAPGGYPSPGGYPPAAGGYPAPGGGAPGGYPPSGGAPGGYPHPAGSAPSGYPPAGTPPPSGFPGGQGPPGGGYPSAPPPSGYPQPHAGGYPPQQGGGGAMI